MEPDKNKNLYAVLDIETTGGQFNEEGITEIAIYRFDGHEVVDQFISLVNPQIPIQSFVVKLTGINNEMLRNAPKFHEVAKRIVEITKDCTLVAHNAVFDCRILATEFRRLGYEFEKQNVCTVELAQKLLPEQPSFSLGKLVRSLGIPIPDRHRASGDAIATLKLFKILLEKDVQKTVITSMVKMGQSTSLSPNLLRILDTVPSKTGIFYVHDSTGKIIYVGKSKNLRKRANQHFTGDSFLCKKIQAEVASITHELTGSELIALLKSHQEIIALNPTLNKLKKKSSYPWSVFLRTNTQGYNYLAIESTNDQNDGLLAFSKRFLATSMVQKIRAENRFCDNLDKNLDNAACSNFENESCNGACVGKISPEEHNANLDAFISEKILKDRSLLIVDRGRRANEKSCVYIENGIYKGFAFFDLNFQITKKEVLKNILVQMPSDIETQYIVQQSLLRDKHFKIVYL